MMKLLLRKTHRAENQSVLQEDQKPNAFDKIQADENDEGKTSAKVIMHDLDLYRYELLTRQESDRDE